MFAIFTSVSMTGTSVSTPTVVANAAGLVVPNRATATATASSKKNHTGRSGNVVRQLQQLTGSIGDKEDQEGL